jgi:peroxiredoxin
MMKMKVFVAVMIVLAVSTCTVFAAGKSSKHPLLIGSIAPSVTLSLVQPTGSSSWHSTDLLGRNAIVFLLVPPRVPLKQVQASLPIYPDAMVNKRDVSTFVVLPNRAQPRDLRQWPVLVDKEHRLLGQYAPKSTSVTAIVIDRAGFLRQVHPIKNKQDLQQLMESVASRFGSSNFPVVQVGQKAPDFIIKDMDGTVRSLHQLRGKEHLLLTFFPKCFTFTCGMQLSSLRDSRQALRGKHLQIWGVSVDEASGPRGQKAFADYLHLNFPLLPDPGHQLCLLYGSVYSPDQMSSRMSVLIDKNGIVRWIDKQIDPRHYGDDVLAKMKELGMD